MLHNVHVKFHSEALLEELEARQLFSGGIEGILADNNEPEIAVHMDVCSEPEIIKCPETIAESTENLLRQELVFIDTEVENYQQLLNGIISQDTEERNIEVVLLDKEQDGIQQITETLADFQNLDAVHIISHASDNGVELGNKTLDAVTLNENLLEINAWGDAFTEEGDFLIYGCNLASTEEGKSLVDAISQLTQTDVTASDDLTGHADLGGDWDLEYQTGTVEAAIIINPDLNLKWVGTLDTSTGLVGHWTFDTDATDSSGNNNDGTLTNGATIDTATAANIVGDGKLSLDGIDDYVDLNARIANFSGLNEGTISAWVKLTDTGENTILGLSDQGDNLKLAKFSVQNGQLKWLTYNDAGQDVVAQSTQTINDGNWHHVAVTVDASGNTLYIDGQVAPATYGGGGDGSTQGFFNDINDIDSMDIGHTVRNNTAETNYNGSIDDVRVYNRALTTSDIVALYNFPTDISLSQSTSVNIVNPGFEAQALGEDNTSQTITGWSSPANADTSVWNPTIFDYTKEAPEGQNVVFIRANTSGDTISQVLSDTFQAGRSYTLSTQIGEAKDNLNDASGWEMHLYAGGLSLGSVSNSDFDPNNNEFVKATLHLDADTLAGYSAKYGSALEIRFYNIGDPLSVDVVDIDDVQLEYTAITVSEVATNGTVVANVSSTTDKDINDVHRYTLSNNAGGRFAISSAGVITVADSTQLNNAINSSHNVTIRTTDAAGLTYDEVVTIQVSSNNAPTDLITSGALNFDGSWGGISASILELDNRTDFTVELEIRPSRIETSGWSYALITQTTNWNDNGFYLDIYDGKLDYAQYNNTVYKGGAVSSPGELKVGSWQTVTLTRDASNTIIIYLDGVQIATGTTAEAIVDSAGDLTFLDNFEGDVRDIRVFNRALTGSEANTGLNSDLLLHYDFEEGNGTAILDRNTPTTSNNGTIVNPAAINWVTIKEIPENSAAGTVIGFLSADDPDAGDSLTYTIQNDPSNNFEIVGREILVKAGATLNYDSASSHVITIRVTDSDTPGLTYDEDVTIQLNKAPTTGNATSGSPEDSASITINLNGSDVDGNVTHFKLVNLPSNGTLYLDSSLTAPVNANQDYARSSALLPMYFVPNANWAGSTGFTYLAKDDSGQYSRSAGTATITVTSANDAPLFVGADIVSNGTFDTDLNGWAPTGNVDFSSGEARFGQVGGPNGVLSQTLTTSIGTTYYVTFDYGDRSTSASQYLQFTVNGSASLISADITTGNSENTLGLRAFSFVADSTTTTITFTDTSPSHSGVRGYIDNVKVLPLATPLSVLNYSENDGAVVIDNQIALLDIDDNQLESAKVQITNNFMSSEDTLAFVNQNGISGSWDSATGILTLTGTASIADYETALSSITYANSSETPSELTRTVSYTVNDGAVDSDIATRGISVSSVNDAPVIIKENFPDSQQSMPNSLTRSTAMGDIDGDGDIDMVVVNYGESNTVLLNDGNGVFTDTGQVFSPGYPFGDSGVAVALGDMDNDGDLDMVVANASGFNKLYINNGHGVFSQGANFDPSPSTSVALGDIDNDGDLDIVTGNLGQANKVYLNDGTGGLTFDQAFNFGGTMSVTLGDIDGDGDLDLISGNRIDANTIYLNDGSGNYTLSGNTVGTNTETRAVTLADLDGDGDLDLVEANYSGSNYIFINDGNGVFSNHNSTSIMNSTSVAVGDIDNDGDVDLVFANNGQFNRIAYNDGAANFQFDFLGTALNDSNSIDLADINGDGDLDIIVGNGSDHSNAVYDNQLATRFTEGGSVQTVFSTVNVIDIDSADFNGGSLAISYSAGGDAGDQLSVRHQGMGAGQIGFGRGNVYYEGNLIGTPSLVDSGINGNQFSIALSGNPSIEAVSALLNNITFLNTSDAPTASRTLSIMVSDGDGGTSNPISQVVTVTAVNDAPVITIDSTNNFTEDSGTLVGAEVAAFSTSDAEGDTVTVTLSDTINYGLSGNTVVLTQAGLDLVNAGTDLPAFTLTPNDTFTDGIPQNVDPSVTATNDAPTVVNSIPDQTAIEDDVFIFKFNTNTFNDVDGDSLTYTSDASGWLAFDAANRTFGGTPLNADVGTLTVTVTASDGHGGSVSDSFNIAISNTNDAAVIAGVDSGRVQEDISVFNNSISTSGLLTISDEDNAEAIFKAETIAGNYGELAMQEDGSWSYSADNAQTAIQQLDLGESITDIITVSAIDNTPHNIVITINGTDDISVIAGTFTGSVSEDGALISSAVLTITDIDSSDSNRFENVIEQAGENGYGTFSIIENVWSFTLNNSHAEVQELDSGEILTDTYIFIAPDGVAQQVSVTINGAEDVPVLDLVVSLVARDGEAFRQTIAASDVDVEAISITASKLPVWLNLIDNGDGTALLTGIPGNSDVGEHSLVLVVSDGEVSSSQSLTVKVVNTHDDALLLSRFFEEPGFSSTAVINENKVDKEEGYEVVDLSVADRKDEGEEVLRQQQKIDSVSQQFEKGTGLQNIDEELQVLEDTVKPLGNSSHFILEKGAAKWHKSQLLIFEKVDLRLEGDKGFFELSETKVNGDLWDSIDLMKEQMHADADAEKHEKRDFEIEFVAAASIGITAGFVNWVLRGGALLSSLLSSASLFKQFDPLAVVFSQNKTFENKSITESEENPSDIEKLFDKKSTG